MNTTPDHNDLPTIAAQPLLLTRSRLSFGGGVELLDATLRADAVISQTVPRDTLLTVTGVWPEDRLLPVLAEYWRHEAQDPDTPVRLHQQVSIDVHEGTITRFGGLVLASAHIAVSHVIRPSGIVPRGARFSITGKVYGTDAVLRGWNDPDPVIEPPAPRSLVRRVARDEMGRIEAITEEVL